MPVRSPLLLLTAGAVILLVPSLANAQIVSRTAGGGLHVRAPFVNVAIPPLDLIAARTPAGGRRFFGRRRGLAPPPRAARRPAPQQQPDTQQPTPQVPELAPGTAHVPAPATVPEGVENSNLFPTPEKLAAMDVFKLKATLQDVSSQLQNRLKRLATGTGWQRHLKIPGEVLFAPAQNPMLVKKLLAKFDAVAGNPRYAKIAGLPSFIATGVTLRQLLAVSEEHQRINPPVTTAMQAKKQAVAENEILPTPAEPEQPNATRGERSILKRASR